MAIAAPSNLFGTINRSGNVMLAWDRSVPFRPEVEYYELYRENEPIYSGPANSRYDYGIHKGQTATYHAVAVDVNGVASDPSNSVTMTRPLPG